MKRMKKLMASVLALAMVLSLCVFAEAAGATVSAEVQGGGSGYVTGATLTFAGTEDTGLNNAVVTVGYDGDSEFSAVASITGVTGYAVAPTLSSSATKVEITKDSNPVATLTLTGNSSDLLSTSTWSDSIKLTVTAAAPEPQITASATISPDDKDITAVAFASEDTGLNGKTVTLAYDTDTDYQWEATTSAEGYTISESGITNTITLEKDNATAGTITLTGTLPSTGDNLAVSYTITLAVVSSANGIDGISDLDADGEGNATGTGSLEDVDPDKVINVIMPVVPENAFNMILDPHDLLKDTGYARIKAALTGDVTDVEFPTVADGAESNHLFFNKGLNEAGNKSVYGTDSVELQIFNKSQIDINVALAAEVTKPADVDFSFAESADAVKTETGAAMYLALTNTPAAGSKASGYTAPAASTTKVEDIAEADKVQDGPDAQATASTTIPAVKSVFKRFWTADDGYFYNLNSDDTDGTKEHFNSTAFKLGGTINNKDGWDDLKGKTIGVKLTWIVTNGEGVATDADPIVTVTQAATAANDTLKLSYTLGSGSGEMTAVDSITFVNPNNVTVTWTTTSNPALTIDTMNNTIQVVVNGAFAHASSKDFAVNFSGENNATKTVTFNPKVAASN